MPFTLKKIPTKNKRQEVDWWIKRFERPESETGIRQNFWRNHLQKHFQTNKKK